SAAGHDRDLSGQGLGLGHAVPPWTAATAFSSEAGSSTLWPRTPSSVRLSRPVSTRPGPTSRNAVAPSRCNRSVQSVQRTGLATCCTRKGFTSSAVVVRAASTFRTTPMRGALTVTCSSSAARRSAAGFMSAQWNGALTGSITLFLAPPARAPAGHRALYRRPVPGNGDLARRVDVGHADHLALRGLRAHLLRGRQVHAEQRGHSSGADRHRLLHELAAPADEPHGRCAS